MGGGSHTVGQQLTPADIKVERAHSSKSVFKGTHHENGHDDPEGPRLVGIRKDVRELGPPDPDHLVVDEDDVTLFRLHIGEV